MPLNASLIKRLALRLKKGLEDNVHPQKGATIVLLDSFLRAALDGAPNSYYGTFPADMIPPTLTGADRFQIVVNTSRTTDPPELGGHFIVIEGDRDSVLYIDPFGLPCSQPDISRFIKDCGRKGYYNKTPIQDTGSVFCPLYCALFVLYYHVSPSWELSFSSSDLKSNEKKCMEQIVRLIDDPLLIPK